MVYQMKERDTRMVHSSIAHLSMD